MINTFNKKLATITLMVLLSSLSEYAMGAQLTSSEKQQIISIAKSEIEYSLPKMIAEITQENTLSTEIKKLKSLTVLSSGPSAEI